jgi:hypothetical protein
MSAMQRTSHVTIDLHDRAAVKPSNRAAQIDAAVRVADRTRRIRRWGYRDRRLCRPPDCADLDTACVAQREIPSRDIGTILCGCPAARLRLGAIAHAGLACSQPILGDGIGVKRWHR